VSRKNGDQRREEKSKKKKKPPIVPLDRIDIPDGMDTPRVRKAIFEWCEYKRKRGETYKDPAKQISKLLAEEQFGGDPETFIKAVDCAIARNWAGCFARNDYGTHKSTGESGRIYGTDWSKLPTRKASSEPET
jgi:hypothetical protein